MSSIDTTSSHYKGKFNNIYEVQEKYPNGGVAGDYVDIAGWAHYWEADRGTWCVNEKRDEYWDELLTSISSNLGSLGAKISDESTAREKADTALQGKIDQEVRTRQAAVSNEATSRSNADAALENKISEEAKARQAAIADEATARGKTDAAEADARKAADTALRKAINALGLVGYSFVGIANPDTAPGTPTQNVYYIATKEGDYNNFKTGITIAGESSEEVIHVEEGEIAFLLYNGFAELSDNPATARVIPSWKKLTLDTSNAVIKIVKERIAGIEGGVAPLNREGVVPMDYLPVEDIRDELMVSCTQDEYDAMVQAGTVKDDTYYNILEE